jgi:hypothetical protein
MIVAATTPDLDSLDQWLDQFATEVMAKAR